MPQAWLDESTPLRTVPAQPYVSYPYEGTGPVDFVEHFSTTADPRLEGSWSYGNNFGPYTMAPGQEVRIVVFDGVCRTAHFRRNFFQSRFSKLFIAD